MHEELRGVDLMGNWAFYNVSCGELESEVLLFARGLLKNINFEHMYVLKLRIEYMGRDSL